MKSPRNCNFCLENAAQHEKVAYEHVVLVLDCGTCLNFGRSDPKSNSQHGGMLTSNSKSNGNFSNAQNTKGKTDLSMSFWPQSFATLSSNWPVTEMSKILNFEFYAEFNFLPPIQLLRKQSWALCWLENIVEHPTFSPELNLVCRKRVKIATIGGKVWKSVFFGFCRKSTANLPTRAPGWWFSAATHTGAQHIKNKFLWNVAHSRFAVAHLISGIEEKFWRSVSWGQKAQKKLNV